MILSFIISCTDSMEDNVGDDSNITISDNPNIYDPDPKVNDTINDIIVDLPISTTLVAKAGFDINIKLGSKVQLNGSMSFDNNLQNLIEYEWELIDKPDVYHPN